MLYYQDVFYKYMQGKQYSPDHRFIEVFTKNHKLCGDEEDISISPLELVEQNLKYAGCKCAVAIGGNKVSSIIKCKTEAEWQAYNQPTKIKVTLYKNNKQVSVAYYICSEELHLANGHLLVKPIFDFIGSKANSKYVCDYIENIGCCKISYDTIQDNVRTLIKSFVTALDRSSYNLVDLFAFSSTFRNRDFELFGHLFGNIKCIDDDYVKKVDNRVDELLLEYPCVFGSIETIDKLSRPYS